MRIEFEPMTQRQKMMFRIAASYIAISGTTFGLTVTYAWWCKYTGNTLNPEVIPYSFLANTGLFLFKLAREALPQDDAPVPVQEENETELNEIVVKKQ